MTVPGTLEGSGNILAQGYYRIHGSGVLLQLEEDAWTNATTHQVLYNGWTSSTGDYVYLSAAGNGTPVGRIIVSDSGGFYFGTSSTTTGAITNSATAPLTNTRFRVDNSGNMTVTGDISLPYGSINDSGTDLVIHGTNAVVLKTDGGTALTIPNNSVNATFGGTITSGQINATTSSDATAAIIATNTGGVSSIIQRWVGDSDALDVRCIGTGDYQISNSEQTNGIDFYDGTGGLAFRYNNAIVAQINSLGGFNLATGSYKVNGTTVIDSSRNLTNIGSTISSAAGSVFGHGFVSGSRGFNFESGNTSVATIRFDADTMRFWSGGAGGGNEKIRINDDATDSGRTLFFDGVHIQSGVSSDTIDENNYNLKVQGAGGNGMTFGTKSSSCLLYTSPSPRDRG